MMMIVVRFVDYDRISSFGYGCMAVILCCWSKTISTTYRTLHMKIGALIFDIVRHLIFEKMRIPNATMQKSSASVSPPRIALAP